MPRFHPSGCSTSSSVRRARRSVSARSEGSSAGRSGSDAVCRRSGTMAGAAGSECSSAGRSGSDAVCRRDATMTCALAYGKRFNSTRLAALAPSRSRSRGSPSTARQKTPPASVFAAPMYAMRHGAQRTCMERSVDGLGVVGRPRLAVDAQAGVLAALEERDPLGVDRDERSCLRVATLARLALLDDEAAETANFDALAAHERLGEAVEDLVHDHLGVAPREPREELHHLVDEIALRHGGPPIISGLVSGAGQ